MIFELAEDFQDVLEAIPTAHSRRHLINLMNEAMVRDIQFIASHRTDYPQAFFQSMWNYCWWFDSPAASAHYASTANEDIGSIPPPSMSNVPGANADHNPTEGPTSSQATLFRLLDDWSRERRRSSEAPWLRALRPPVTRLDSALGPILQHDTMVTALAFYPDSKQLVTGTFDGLIHIWELARGKKLATLHGHARTAQRVSVTPDGMRILTTSHDNCLLTWDARTFSLLSTLPLLRGNEDFGGTNASTEATWSQDGQRIATWPGDGSLRIWDATNGHDFAMVHLQRRDNRAAFSPDGNCLAIGFACEVQLIDVATGKGLIELRGHDDRINALEFSQDGKQIAAASWDSVWIWDVATGQLLFNLQGHEDWIVSIAFSKDGDTLASGSIDQTVRIWNIKRSTATVLRGHGRRVSAVAISPDNALVASASPDASVRLWKLGREGGSTLRGDHEDITDVTFTPSGNSLATTGVDFHTALGAFPVDYTTLRLWNIGTGEDKVVVEGFEKAVCVAMSRDGRLCAYGQGAGIYTITIVSTDDYQVVTTLPGHKSTVRGLTFSADGQWLLGHSDGSHLWDVRSGAEARAFRGMGGTAAFSTDGLRIVSGSPEKDVQIWDTQTGSVVKTFSGHASAVIKVAFSGDDLRVVSQGQDNTIRIWDVETGECLDVINGHGDVDAIAEGSKRFPYRALVRGVETVIEDSATGQELCWFPAALKLIKTHSGGRGWAAAWFNHLYLLQLEREPTEFVE